MIRIVILDKRFVAVGLYKQGTDWCELDNAAFIRRWGTTRGLGEIAENGPTSNTVLDKSPNMEFPLHSVVNTIECVTEKWEKVLGIGAAPKAKNK